MKRRLALLALLAFTALAVAASAVGGAKQAPVAGTIAVLGPYGDSDEEYSKLS